MKARHRLSPKAVFSSFAALLSLAACQGQIAVAAPGLDNGPPGSSTGGLGASSGAAPGTGAVSSGGATGGGAAIDCTVAHAPALHARLLTPSQYDNTVSDLVKVGGDPSKDFGGGVATQLDDLSVELRANAAADIAHQAALSLAQWSPCTSPPATAAACEQQIIDKIGPQVYRHPLAADERAELQTLFDAGVQEKDFATGVEWFLSGVLQSPDFLYQLSKLQAAEVAGKLVANPSLVSWRAVSRISICGLDAGRPAVRGRKHQRSGRYDQTSDAAGSDAQGPAIFTRRHWFLQLVAQPGRFPRGRARRRRVHDRRRERPADVSADERHPALPRRHTRQRRRSLFRHELLPQRRAAHLLRTARWRQHIQRHRHGKRRAARHPHPSGSDGSFG